MKLSELDLLRTIIDIVDGVQTQKLDNSAQDQGYSDRDIKRFKQIVDLKSTEEPQPINNSPNPQYAGVEAVTVDAGSDGWQGTKHPADLRGEHASLYPGKVYGSD
jgi:hypothetical protein